MEDIIQEKISADHLLYVSLKYTKTCDVIVNLLTRWTKMIDTSIDAILEHAVKKKKILSVPTNPVGKMDTIKKLFKKDENFIDILELHDMFKRVKELHQERVGEFRKNVALKLKYKGDEVIINLEQLKEYAQKLEKFISSTKQFLLS